MAATVFPLPVTTISEKTFTTTVPSSATPYVATVSMSPGVYRITCVSSTITTVGFFSGNTLIATALTASGTVDVTVASAVTRLSITTNTGSNIAVTVTFQSAPIVISGVSGTLTTITSSGTYTTQGIAIAVAVGGGGGGGYSAVANGGTGGGSGGIGTGGTGSGTQNSNTATSGTGYGAGGGGGSRIINNAAGSGSQGVVYLIGGF